MILLFLQNQHPCFQVTAEQALRFEAQLPPAADLPVRICRSETEFTTFLPQATAVFVWTFKQEWFEIAPKLRHVCTPAAGRDYFKVSPPPYVTMHYGSFQGDIMGETAVACVLAVCHGILQFANIMSGNSPEQSWPRLEMANHGHRLAGSTVVVLGYGHIGRIFADMILPFGPKIIGITRTHHPELKDSCASKGIILKTADEMDSALAVADHIVCFLPSGPETTDLIDSKRLAILKPSAFIYNFGRGNLIDENALVQALNASKIGGAVLDVFKTEPLPETSPLRSARNCWIYPHASAFAPDYLDLYFSKAAKAMREAALNG